MCKDVEKTYVTLGEFSLDDVLSYRTLLPSKKEYLGNDDQIHSVNMASQRYHVFAANNECCVCGLKGTKMLLQYPKRVGEGRSINPHFNLYGEENGVNILFTKDHIHPVSKGGNSQLENYRTMCCVCNNLRANFDLGLSEMRLVRKTYNQYGFGAAIIHRDSILGRVDRVEATHKLAMRHINKIYKLYDQFMELDSLDNPKYVKLNQNMTAIVESIDNGTFDSIWLEPLAGFAKLCEKVVYSAEEKSPITV